MTSPLHGRRAGFTLIELILAVTLIALVLVAAYEMYIASLKTAQAGEAEIDCYQTARAALTMLADDLRSTVATQATFGAGLSGQDGDDSKFEGDTLTLTCTAAPRWRPDPSFFETDPLPPRGDFRRVVYRLVTPAIAAEEDTVQSGIRPTLGLVREVRTNLTSQDAADQVTQVLSRNVVSFQVLYHDGTDWQTTWSTSGNTLPLAVKITLLIVPRSEDVMDESGQAPAGSTIEEMYPQARRFTTVVNLLGGSASGTVRVMQ
jgi:prepilin-type N-terminal cleavage/methylation domain-containing protein